MGYRRCQNPEKVEPSEHKLAHQVLILEEYTKLLNYYFFDLLPEFCKINSFFRKLPMPHYWPQSDNENNNQQKLWGKIYLFPAGLLNLCHLIRVTKMKSDAENRFLCWFYTILRKLLQLGCGQNWQLLKKKVQEIYKCYKQSTVEKSSVTLQCADWNVGCKGI